MSGYFFVSTGSAAVNKAAEVVMKLAIDFEVGVFLTETARSILDEKTYDRLEANGLILNLSFDDSYNHLDVKDKYSKFVVCPATANSISDISTGRANNFWLTVLLSYDPSDVYVLPAMNCDMYDNPGVSVNIELLRSRGYRVCGPNVGELACGDFGMGRMLEVDEIVPILTGNSKSKKILITAGATREYLDEVRYLSNSSTGQTGILIADYYDLIGFDVTLIIANRFDIKRNYKVEYVVSADEMYDVVSSLSVESDIFISTAAVSDFKFASISKGKISKVDFNDEFDLPFVKTVDILGSLDKSNLDLVVGFTVFQNYLEVDAINQLMVNKLESKGCDLLVGNYSKTMGSSSSEFDYFFMTKDKTLVGPVRLTKFDLPLTLLEFCSFE